MDIAARHAERSRFRAVGSNDERLQGRAFPCRAIDDRLPVRRKSRGAHDPAPECQALERRLSRRGWRVCPPSGRGGDGCQQRGPSRQQRGPPERGGRGSGRRSGDLAGRRSRRGRDLRQIELQITRRLKPFVRVLFEAMPDDSFERRRNDRRCRGEGRRLLSQDRAHGVGGRVTLEGALARDHLVENGAEAEDVRARVHRLRAHLLGRHVPRPSPAPCRRPCLP